MNKIDIKEDDYTQLKHFKKIFDSIIEEESKFEDYIHVIISAGLNSMFRDIIPQDQETLWNTIMALNKKNPEFFSKFIMEMILRGENKEKLKEKLDYIS